MPPTSHVFDDTFTRHGSPASVRDNAEPWAADLDTILHQYTRQVIDTEPVVGGEPFGRSAWRQQCLGEQHPPLHLIGMWGQPYLRAERV